MIKKINKIKDFGVFKDFKGNALPEFQKYNLIYGWNYSGKTTFSRVFRCLEKKELHNDFGDAIFELAGESGKYDNTFKNMPNTKVFNSDFVKYNLKLEAESENIEPIFLLGEETINLQNQLEIKKQDKKEAEEKLNELEKNIKTKEDNLNKARNIADILSLRNFNRDNLRLILERSSEEQSVKLNETEFESYKLQALSTDEKTSISRLSLDVHDTTELKNEVEKLLQRQISSSHKIEKLLNSSELSNWVEQGKRLHEDKIVCEFCGSILPSDLFEKLNEHFSKDYDILKLALESLLNKLNRSKININFPSKNDFYSDIAENFIENKKILETEIEKLNNTIADLIKCVENKKEKPFDIIEFSSITDNTHQLGIALEGCNKIIDSNNKRGKEFEANKSSAKEKLKGHFAAEFEIEERYFAIQTELKNKKENIKIIEQSILDIESKLDESVKGAEKVNEYLKMFFGKDDIVMKAEGEKFKLKRGDENAKNLSEGEKTAISFAYFTAKLRERRNELFDTIVYIDDPVSSLDSNHLFNIYSFIKNEYHNVKQLFISTHNFEFFNLLKGWMEDKKVKHIF